MSEIPHPICDSIHAECILDEHYLKEEIAALQARITEFESQSIRWLPGGAQGAEMPDFEKGIELLAVWSEDIYLLAYRRGHFTEANNAWDDSGEFMWKEIWWYIPTSSLHVPPMPTTEKGTKP